MKLDSRIDAVYSYGFSYSKVDSPYIIEIIKRISPNAVWYFTEHEAQNREALRKKKMKLRRYGIKEYLRYMKDETITVLMQKCVGTAIKRIMVYQHYCIIAYKEKSN